MEVSPIDWLPTPEVIMARSKAAAVADLLLSPDPDLRQYLCNAHIADGITFAYRHDGAGSYYYILQSGDAMAIKAIALRKSMGPDPLCRFQRAPEVATSPLSPLALRLLTEEDFRYQELSFLAWCDANTPWQGLSFRVDGETSFDMGRALLELVCVGPKTYYVYAQAYHEVTLDPTALKSLFKLEPMDEALATALVPEVNFAQVSKDLKQIGYPLA